LDYADVEKCVRHICDRARACISKTYGHLERELNRLRQGWRLMEGFKKCLNLIMKNIYLYLYNSVVSRVEGQIQKGKHYKKMI